ncbi:MAG TPA: site-specific integrase [Solirubrobacteraceae bacterium]|jgi:integrase
MPKRAYGTGHLYEKSGAYYGRWRTLDGRQLNRKVGRIRRSGESDGLTRPQAERELRRLQDAEERAPKPARGVESPTVDEAGDSLRQELRIGGARRSYLEGCESMQRVHISPRLGALAVTNVTTAHVEAVASAMLADGLSPKTIRNVVSFLHSIFEHAIERGWAQENPARRASRPGRRRKGDANPDLQFLTLDELEAVLRAIPDEVVIRTPAPSRRGRRGPAPPPPPDVLGPVLRVVVLAAAMTGLRQSELLGLRWRDVDWSAQCIRVRNTFVRGEHSTDGKSDLSTRRSVPMADRLAGELDRWSQRTEYHGNGDLVFAHPQTGSPLDRSKVTKRFKAACRAAGVREVKFHDLRHTFATRLAASGQPLRTIQEFLGHADSKTTQIYAHYAPSEREVQMVNEAFTGSAASSPDVPSDAVR